MHIQPILLEEHDALWLTKSCRFPVFIIIHLITTCQKSSRRRSNMFPILNKDMTVEDASMSDAEVNQYHEDGWIVPKWEIS